MRKLAHTHTKEKNRFLTESSVVSVLFQNHINWATVQMAKPIEMCSWRDGRWRFSSLFLIYEFMSSCQGSK